MPSSYISSHFHIVFSTKNRLRSIGEERQPKLWAYMAGIATNHGMHALAVGGIEDHVPVLVQLPAAMSIAKATQVLKAKFVAMDERGPREVRMAGRIFCVQRESLTDTPGDEIHCQPTRSPQKA